MSNTIERVKYALGKTTGTYILLPVKQVEELVEKAEAGERVDCDFTVVRDTPSNKDMIWACTACGTEIKRLRTLGKPHFCPDCGGKAPVTETPLDI